MQGAVRSVPGVFVSEKLGLSGGTFHSPACPTVPMNNGLFNVSDIGREWAFEMRSR